jgi:peptidoglycan/LPS O-acetylase OafA/YrhL
MRSQGPDRHRAQAFDRVPGLDLLRAAAISLVVLEHQGLISGRAAPTGGLGVDLFFVLSGFLIGGILFDMGENLGRPGIVVGFWLRRWLRTLPNYYLFLGINILVWLPFYRPHVVQYIVPPYLVFLQSFAHRPGWFFIESWSLCVEEWFYLFFPLALWAGLALGRRFGRTFWVTVLAMMLASLGLRMAAPPPKDWGMDINMVVVYKFDALAWGASASAAVRLWPGFWARHRRTAAAAGLIIVADCFVYQLRHDMNASFFARSLFPTVITLGWALALPWASGCTRLPGAWFSGVVGAVARWSYSLYLVNFMASVLIGYYLMPRLGGGPRAVAEGEFLYFAVILSASAFLYRWYEGPILRQRSRIRLCREAALAQESRAWQSAGEPGTLSRTNPSP